MRSAPAFVKAERELRDRVARLHERLMETRREQHLGPEHVERAVRTALRLADKPDLEPVSLPAHPKVGSSGCPPLLAPGRGAWTGLEHPYTHSVRPITFDHDVAKGRDDVVLVHLNHPLVQMSLRLLRAEVWARDDVKKLHRVTVRSVPDAAPDGAGCHRPLAPRHHRRQPPPAARGAHRGRRLPARRRLRREERVTEVRGWLDASVRRRSTTAPSLPCARASRSTPRRNPHRRPGAFT